MQARCAETRELIKRLSLGIADGGIKHYLAAAVFTGDDCQVMQQICTNTLPAGCRSGYQIVDVAKAAMNKIFQQAVTCQRYWLPFCSMPDRR